MDRRDQHRLRHLAVSACLISVSLETTLIGVVMKPWRLPEIMKKVSGHNVSLAPFRILRRSRHEVDVSRK